MPDDTAALIARLRRSVKDMMSVYDGHTHLSALMDEAADALERLQEQLHLTIVDQAQTEADANDLRRQLAEARAEIEGGDANNDEPRNTQHGVPVRTVSDVATGAVTDALAARTAPEPTEE